MNGYRFDLTCPHCGGALLHHADGTPQAGTCASAVARCEPCRSRYIVSTTVRRAGRWNPREQVPA